MGALATCTLAASPTAVAAHPSTVRRDGTRPRPDPYDAATPTPRPGAPNDHPAPSDARCPPSRSVSAVSADRRVVSATGRQRHAGRRQHPDAWKERWTARMMAMPRPCTPGDVLPANRWVPGIGRSRGGLTTKVHALVDAGIHPVAVLLSPGQAGDNPRLVPLLDALAEGGHRPEHLLADKAYSHPSTRRELRRRRIRHTFPEGRDQVERRRSKGSHGGRPPKVRPRALLPTQQRRTRLRTVQAVARHRDQIRQVRPHLPRRSPTRCHRHPRPPGLGDTL
jgi:putative transposase